MRQTIHGLMSGTSGVLTLSGQPPFSFVAGLQDGGSVDQRIAEITTITGGRPAVTPQAWIDKMAQDAENIVDPMVVGTPTITSVANGAWSDAATWNPARIPTTDDVVSIATTVTYDHYSEDHITDIIVEDGGHLIWATGHDTKLVVDTILTHMNGEFTRGTEANPIPNSDIPGRARSHIVYQAKTDPLASPRLGLMAMGKTRIHGAFKEHSIAGVGDLLTGDTVLQLAASPNGWLVGDQILLSSTSWAGTSSTDPQYTGPSTYWNQYGRDDREQPYEPWLGIKFQKSRDEVRTITAINGNAVTIDAPLVYDHRKDVTTLMDGKVITTPAIVSILTCSVMSESATPQGHRGHQMFNPSNTICCYAEARNLGRTRSDVTLTTASNTGNDLFTTDPANGGVSLADPTNVRGRYPWHLHPNEDGPFLSAPMAIFKCVTAWAPTAEVPQPGWAIVQHSCRAAIEKCIVYNCRGAGIVSELGNEIGQWLDCVVSWARGDGFTYDYGYRAEHQANHNGHMGAGYDCQARQILMQRCYASSCHVMAIYFQQSQAATSRVPQDVALRLRDPFTQGGLRQNYSRDDLTYGVEQAQIPPWNDNVASGCEIGFVVAHRQYVDLSDMTPMIADGFRCINTQTPFLLINYSYNYYFYDFVFKRTEGTGGTAIKIDHDKSFGMSFINGSVMGFSKVARFKGLNYNGFFIDIDHDITGPVFSDWELTGVRYDPPTSATSWNLMGESVMTGPDSWIPAPGNIYYSATDYPIPYPNAGNPGTTDYPVGLDLPPVWPPADVTFPSFVLDPGSDLTMSQNNTLDVEYSGTVYDAVGIRHYPGHYAYAPTSSSARNTHFWERTRRNYNATGGALVERNGAYEESPGVWKMRMWHVDLDRATGEFFTFPVDLSLTGTWDQTLLQDNRVDPNATRPTFPMLSEAIE